MSAAESKPAAGQHWADVLECDMRAELPEIRRAYKRRFRELVRSGVAGPDFGSALERLDLAMKQVRQEETL